jgi:hypothetical protein
MLVLAGPSNSTQNPDRQTDRQTNSFIENSIDAGILLGGNGVLHAMAIARALVLVQSLPVTN